MNDVHSGPYFSNGWLESNQDTTGGLTYRQSNFVRHGVDQ